jgi:IS5 family transposase
MQEAENQIITDYEAYALRPHDSDLLIAAIKTQSGTQARAEKALDPQRPEMAH